MKILFSWLQDYTDFNGPAEEAAELLTAHAYEVEDIVDVDGDAIFDIDVLANRAVDSLSHMGVARELGAITDTETHEPGITLEESDTVADDMVSVQIDDDAGCGRYIARVVENVSVGTSPDWLQKRLEALGQRSINTIVDIANYVMLETGQPLHAFDADKLTDGTIVVRRAGDGEMMTTLDGEEIEMTPDMLVVADAERPVALAGIKGGVRAEVTEETTTVVLESAAFDPVIVRRAARAVGIQTEASRRFEAGLDLVRPVFAIDRAAQLIVDNAGGTVARGRVDIGRGPSPVSAIAVHPDDIEQLLGMSVEREIIKNLLQRLQFDVEQDGEELHVTPPAFRRDVTTVPDVIEEIARLHGYDAVPADPPRATLVSPAQEQDYQVEQMVRDAMVAIGAREASTYSFVGDALVANVGEETDAFVAIDNALSNKLRFLRRSLLPRLLGVAGENAKHRDVVRLFEVGRVFYPQDAGAPEEQRMIGGVFVHREDDDTLFYETKGALESALEYMGIADQRFDDLRDGAQWSYGLWAPGRVAEIHVNETVVGACGDVQQSVLGALDIDATVVAFEMNLAALIDVIEGEREYTAFSRLPAVVRDVAIVVPQETKVADVLNTIEESGAQWVSDVDLFDWYEGDELGDNQKSLAFHIVYQTEDRTLTDDEVNEEHATIEQAFRAEGWEVR